MLQPRYSLNSSTFLCFDLCMCYTRLALSLEHHQWILTGQRVLVKLIFRPQVITLIKSSQICFISINTQALMTSHFIFQHLSIFNGDTKLLHDFKTKFTMSRVNTHEKHGLLYLKCDNLTLSFID